MLVLLQVVGVDVVPLNLTVLRALRRAEVDARNRHRLAHVGAGRREGM